ncbi:MAG TPA: alkaline phosphatase family protein [Candidatus Acidoferrales bacterium]|nr:alkaline phosphatase family protein [Candidatus Acidoferrales bacterium]
MQRISALILAILTLAAASPASNDLAMPRYEHIIVIMDENKDYSQILDPAFAPNISALAKQYGNATNFYAEAHPSEPNYVALVGGDTFGIRDDDGYTCKPGSTGGMCAGSGEPGFVDHTIDAPNLATQLEAAGLTWKGYYESIPAPGSRVLLAGDPAFFTGAKKTALYASKHSGFMNFASVQNDPNRAEHIVGFDRLDRDLAANALPSFALVVPNQCNDMHGLSGANIPPDCVHTDKAGLIKRGDAMIGALVRKIQATRAWASSDNVAIVITFDESGEDQRVGCCGWQPGSAANFGGGHIPTIVITNHGPRAKSDSTPYNHYSLLRTIEDAFGIHHYLGHAAQSDKGVQAMLPLFEVEGG